MRSLREVADAVRAGELKAVEVLDECLVRIERDNPALNAFVHLDPDLARSAAEAVDAKVAAGEDPGLLAGVPFGVKDLEDCAGMPTSHGSLLFKGGPPVAEDSVHVGRLRAAGAVPVGKTAAPEFGAVALTHTKAWGTTRNPWDLSKSPGGSSGGSAAAVAAGMVPFCTASDGGGSTRIPAGFTGLVGFKPSFGRIAKPHFAASQTSVTGVLTTTVADAARHLDVAAGPDDRDRTSLPPSGVVYERAIDELDVSGLRAVWSVDLGFAEVDPEVAAIAFGAAEALVDAAGLALVERPIALTDPMKMWLSAGAADLWMDIEKGMWPDRSDELTAAPYFGLKATETLPVGAFARILMRRWKFEDEVAAIFRDVDLLLTPTTAVPAYPAEGPMTTEINGVTVHPGMSVPFTQLGNLAWNPGISLPAGTTASGLPVGVMITARRHADDVVLRLARLFELARPWPRLAPAYS
ncbi:MAG TPA: amidase [Acidimicrobiales bacterium]|nr:amidase [Acidimicrobiales bacterium]